MAVDQLNPSRAVAFDGPSWLIEQRRAAAERLAAGELPDSSAEEWRYSRIEDLDLGAYVLAEPSSRSAAPTPTAPAVDLGEFSGRLVLVDGRLVATELDESCVAAGVRLGRLADLDVATGDGSAPDAFGDLTIAHGEDPLVISVPRGVTVARPLQVIHIVEADGALVLPRLVVVAGDDAEVTVVEWSTSGPGVADSLVVPRTEVALGAAARVTLVSVNAWGRGVRQVASLSATVGQEATLRLGHVALGGTYARSRFDCRLVGRGATGRLAALYLGDEEQMHDLRTFQAHEARDTTSDLLFKGALDDHARAVYTGMIRVDHEGRGSNANQTNRVIKLSDDAWAESVPNLEIHHNDVRCSHATAVGPIDEDQRFYLESRGVPPETAERLVVNGFFEEVLETIGVAGVVSAVRPLIAARLGGQS